MTKDVSPAINVLEKIVASIDDDQLSAPTPCEGSNVADVLDHVAGFSYAFTAVAKKDFDNIPAGATSDGSKLPPNWRDHVTSKIADLRAAWQDPASWTGTTKIAGMDMPGELAGVITLDEVVLHGWDLAVATGQPYDPPDDAVAAIEPFVRDSATGKGFPGLFGPPVDVPESAPRFDQVLGLAGRDPNWGSSAR